MTLTYYQPETYSRLSGMFENPTAVSNIIEIIEAGQVWSIEFWQNITYFLNVWNFLIFITKFTII